MRTSTPVAFLAAAVLLTSAAAPARAQQLPRSLGELAKRSGVAEPILAASGAEKLLSPDVDVRRDFLAEAIKEPNGALLPLICYLAAGADPDWPLTLTAVKAISLFGLVADRSDVLEYALPLLRRQVADSEAQRLRFSMEEVTRLARWFRLDEEIAPLLEAHFRGDDFNMRAMAFRAIVRLDHPRLVQELVKPAIWEIYRSKKSGIFERRLAVRSMAYLNMHDAVGDLADNLRHDASVAIVSAYALAQLLDPSALKELRKINKTAVHRLRMAAWLARCRMGDERCPKEVIKVVNSHTEHDEIKRIFLGDLGQMPDNQDKARKVLTKAWKHPNPAVRQGAALGLARMDDATGVPYLVEVLQGDWPDLLNLRWRGEGWKRQLSFMESLLRIETDAVDPLVVAMIDVKGKKEDLVDEDGEDKYEMWWRHGGRRLEKLKDWYEEYNTEAVSLCGERRIEAARPRLKELVKDNWGHMKFHALVSQVELGEEGAARFLNWYLPKYDDRLFRDVKAVLGNRIVYTHRLKWSSVFDVCDKFERVGDAELYLPIVTMMLEPKNKADDPMAKGWRRKLEGEKGATAEHKDEDPLRKPPEIPYKVRNQFARRRLVECAARLGRADAAPILARALRDSRAVVRAAALTEIGTVSGRYTLPPGASRAAEDEVWPKAVAWLEEQGAWPE